MGKSKKEKLYQLLYLEDLLYFFKQCKNTKELVDLIKNECNNIYTEAELMKKAKKYVKENKIMFKNQITSFDKAKEVLENFMGYTLIEITIK